MSLENLVGISLESIEPDPAVIKRLLRAAERNIADARVNVISTETRFDAAYKAIMQLANAALQANGSRTLTSQPGHHRTLIQVLDQTIGLDKQSVILLDAFRKQRNVADYLGDTVPQSTLEDCVRQTEALLLAVKNWLREKRPHLLK